MPHPATPCYSLVTHDNGDVRVALSANGNYANYIHDQTQPWASGWILTTSTTADSDGILLLANDRPYLARLLADGIWMQREFEAPQLVALQPSGVTWQSLTSRWSRYNQRLPGLIDLGTRSWSSQGGNQYWYAKYAVPTEADFSASPLQGVAPLLVSFTDRSIPEYGRTISSREWDFNKDGVIDATNDNPVYRFDNAGKYQVQLKVTDSLGGTATKSKIGFINVYGDADNDGIPNNLDNCPNDYNPLQLDLNSNGMGDTCEAPINHMQAASYMTRLRSLTAADKNLQDVTAIMTDGQLTQGISISSTDKNVVSIQMNKEARTIKKLILKMYISNINYNPFSAAVYIMPYGSDLKTPVDAGLSGGSNGWNEIDLTPILHRMDGYGSVKFRIAALNQQVFNIHEISLAAPYDNKEIVAAPESVDFGVMETGKSSTTTIRVSNNGSESLDIIRVRPLASPFAIGTEECSGKTLGSGGFCELSLIFSPAYNSNFSDILRIDSTDADKSSLRINLQGSGTLILNGTVKDAITGYPLNSVTVKVIDSLRTTNVVTDASGNYSIPGMPLGDYTVSFTRFDYQPLALSGTIRQGESNRLDASLSYNYAAISGVVTDQASGAPLSGVTVSLSLSGIKSKDPADRQYLCNDTELTAQEYALVESNDSQKFSCKGVYNQSYVPGVMKFRVRNSFGKDPFTVSWNVLAAKYGDTNEYLAQGFKPTKNGQLTRVGFHLDSGMSEYVRGEFHVLLKSALGGDRGSYLAKSNSNVFYSGTYGTAQWIYFDFPSPVSVTAGQQYYLEINGTYFQWSGDGGYLYNLTWSETDQYPTGSGYRRSGGLWLPIQSLAFQATVDTQTDIIAQPPAIQGTKYVAMYGSNDVAASIAVHSADGSSSSHGIGTNMNDFADGSGYNGKYNGDDLTAYGVFSDYLDRYYDANGWIEVKATGYSTWNADIITDQFGLSFNRSITATTDANGAYSFQALPDGNYTLGFNKIAYADAAASGQIANGQNLSITQAMTLLPPATLRGAVLNSRKNTPLAGVNVIVTDSLGTRTNVSDSQGGYLFSGVYGNYSITFSAVQMQTKTVTGNIDPGQDLVVNISMDPLPIELTIASPTHHEIVATNPVTITGTVGEADSVTVTLENYDSGTTVTYPATITGNTFSATVPLEEWITLISVEAINTYGASASRGIMVTRADFTVKNLGDTGNVMVLEVSGDYNAKNPDGSQNDQPRKTIAKEYFKTHGDVDFLVYLTTFDYAMPEAGAQGFYSEVKNDTEGINKPIFDNSAQFGSPGKLQGTVDLGNVTILAANPYGPKLNSTITTLNHELMHRYGAYVRFRNPDGTMNSALLGKDSAHWSYLLDSKGSLMYGSNWSANQDGSFTATATTNSFSPLDLYLMGIIPKEQVPPMTLIENPAIDRTQVPQLGATISGTPRTITIDDIISAEGERIPNAATSQKQFKVGFVLLTRPGDNTTSSAAAIETLRSAWSGRLAELTRGKGSIAAVAPSLSLQLDSPTNNVTITGPDITVTGTIINSTGAETGVTVNGIPATVTGSRFIANRVPLQLGSNTIIISATDAKGLTATATRSVTAQAGHYLRISSNIYSGTGLLGVSLRLDGSFSITNPSVSVAGPAASVLLPGTSENEYFLKMTVEGQYIVTSTATGPDGNIYTDSLTVTIVNREQLENLLKAKWESMRTALAAGAVEGALAYLPTSKQDYYRELFTALGTRMPVLAEDLPTPEFGSIRDNTARLLMSRQEIVLGQQKTVGYLIIFIKEDGLWKMRGL